MARASSSRVNGRLCARRIRSTRTVGPSTTKTARNTHGRLPNNNSRSSIPAFALSRARGSPFRTQGQRFKGLLEAVEPSGSSQGRQCGRPGVSRLQILFRQALQDDLVRHSWHWPPLVRRISSNAAANGVPLSPLCHSSIARRTATRSSSSSDRAGAHREALRLRSGRDPSPNVRQSILADPAGMNKPWNGSLGEDANPF